MAESNEGATEKGKPAGNGVSIRFIGAVTIIIAIALGFYAFLLAGQIAQAEEATEAEEARYIQCNDAVENLQVASDFLTDQARMFVTTGRTAYMDAYIVEIDETNRRGEAVSVLDANLSGDQQAASALEQALAASDTLAETELAAMSVAAEYYGINEIPGKVASADVPTWMRALKPEQKIAAARDLVLSKEYEDAKQGIEANVEASSIALLLELDAELSANETHMQNLLFQLRIDVALLLCVIMLLVLVVLMYVLKPLDRYIKRIRNNEPLEAAGSFELRYLADAYNTVYEDNTKRIEQLREFSERDPLTGISNRNGYNNFLATHTRNIALLLIDIDDFKEFNKVYGHDTGDAVMVKLAGALGTAFRSTDFPCRIESDKFAVIMTNMSSDLRDAVSTKIELVNSILGDDSDDLPLITLSVGAAFSTEGMTDAEIYHAAEQALRQVQENGKNGLAFYGENN